MLWFLHKIGRRKINKEEPVLFPPYHLATVCICLLFFETNLAQSFIQVFACRCIGI